MQTFYFQIALVSVTIIHTNAVPMTTNASRKTHRYDHRYDHPKNY